MRKSTIYGMLIPAVALTMASCDDNAWNDKLDGFDGEAPITVVKTVEYTLTAADYAAIASNSTNLSLAADNTAALKAVGTQCYFTDEITAAQYVPAFLASTSFPYFTLDNGSAIKLTYNKAVGLPAEISELAAAGQYVLTTEDYQKVWGSDDDFINGFAPSKTAAKNMGKVLSENFPEAASGDYLIVTYQSTDQEPIYVSVEGGDEDNYTHVKATSLENGGQCVIVADGNAATTVAETKGYGYFGIAEVAEDGKGINLPADAETSVFTFVKVDGGYNILDCYGRYVYQSGTYNSFNFAADCPETGAVWTVTIEADGSAKILNTEVNKYMQYDPNYSSYGSYEDARGVLPSIYVSTAKAAKAPVAEVPLTTEIGVWKYSGSSWSTPSNVVVLQPADYTAMGQKYANLSNDGPAELLPIFLKTKFPYAAADDSKFVLYQYYGGGTTKYVCDQYVYDGAEWTINNGIETETAQFVKNKSAWNYDPSVVIVLPAGRGVEISTTYYQACVNWVYYNIDVPLGSTSITSGMFYVTSYGNNEYYSGSSAYQGNVDLRPAKAIEQYPAGYAGMSDEEILELMKYRFAYEVLPGALQTLHPDAKPVEGIDVTYTITFDIYTGSNSTETIIYKVTGPAQFEMQECTWWPDGKPAGK